MKFVFLLIFTFTFFLSFAASENKVRMLYNSLNPKSISEHLAFYKLYGETECGKQALHVAWKLLSGNAISFNSEIERLIVNPSIIDTLVNLVNKPSDQETAILTLEESKIIKQLGANLLNRKFKGYYAASEEEVLKLPPEEIDLARGLFLSQFGCSEEAMQKLASYEAMIDLMALQILAKLPANASPETKIAVMNELVFEEMGFRFPPHSLYAKDVDIYTFLPSVLDSRKGVCLGVSILYICLAERLGLKLEMVTPPGHIYVRYRDGSKIINIETTARGIHIDCEDYLTVDTRSLELRNKKEVIGLAHYNLAATFWHREDPKKIIDAYLKAKPYLEEDMQLKALLGFAYLLQGEKETGENLVNSIRNHLPEHAVSKDTMADEYLNGLVGIEGLKAVFKSVDENRSSIIEKKNALEAILKDHPKFASGIFSLATTWLQLHREKEALELLEEYHKLDPNNPTAEYYLAVLHLERYDYNKAWKHLIQTENLVRSRFHSPKALKELRKELSKVAPY